MKDCKLNTCKYWNSSYEGNCSLNKCIYKVDNVKVIKEGKLRDQSLLDMIGDLDDDQLAELYQELAISDLFEEEPVGIHEFLLSPQYLDLHAQGSAWQEVINILEGVFNGKNEEGFLSGGIGAGKSTLAAWAMLYAAYRVLILKDPHAAYRMVAGHPIEILNLSLNENAAKEIVFTYVLNACENSNFFKNPKYAPDPKVKSRLMFPKGVCISYGNGSKNAAIGRNVIMGVLDEIAFYPVNNSGDRAKIQFDNVGRRIKSRYAKHGLPDGVFKGLLMCISSPCHQDDFMENKFRERRPNAYYRRITSFDSKDVGNYCGKTFLFCTECKIVVDEDHIRHGKDIVIRSKHAKSK